MTETILMVLIECLQDLVHGYLSQKVNNLLSTDSNAPMINAMVGYINET